MLATVEKTTRTISKLVVSLREWMEENARGSLLAFFLSLDPVPASRPRVGRYGTYYTKNYTKFRNEAERLVNVFEGAPTDEPVLVLVENIVKRPKTGKLLYPRGDVDNYAKGTLDAFTKAEKMWLDDNQVVGLLVFKRYAAEDEEPGIIVNWFIVKGDKDEVL